MEIGEVLYPRTRAQWRAWLQKNHTTVREIWVRRFRKGTGKPSITYDDLIEECLCFGWIDGIVKKLDDDSNVVRITPRRSTGSYLSELNRQRVWKLQRLGRMTPTGLAPIADQVGSPDAPFSIPDWIRKRLREEPVVWRNFNSFPRLYRRLKVGWIAELPLTSRREEAEKRLAYLIKMTRQGKTYGTIPEVETDR